MVTASRTALSVHSVDEIVSLVYEPKIYRLQKDGGQMNTAMIIAVMVSKMADDMHMKDGLTESNIDEIVRRLTTDDDVRYWLTLADISLLCRRVAEGYYGKTYGRFGLGEFNECLVAYCNERRECHRRQNDKVVVTKEEAALAMKELGYSLGKDGRLIIPEEQKERRLAQPLYRYDDKGKRVGVNLNGALGKEEKIKLSMEIIKNLMREDRNLDLDEAIDRVKAQLNKSNTGGNDEMS